MNNKRLYALIEVHRTGGVAAAGSQWLSKDGAATLGFRFALARQFGPTRTSAETSASSSDIGEMRADARQIIFTVPSPMDCVKTRDNMSATVIMITVVLQ